MKELPKIVRELLAGRLREKQRSAAPADGGAGPAHPDVNLLSAFTERRLAPPERARVLEHLATCPECRDEVQLALKAAGAFSAEGLPERLGRPVWWWRPALRWVAVTTAAIVVGLVFRSAIRNRDRSLESASIIAARGAVSQATRTLRAENQIALDARPVVPAPPRAEARVLRRLEPGSKEASAPQTTSKSRASRATPEPVPASEALTVRVTTPAQASAPAEAAAAQPAPAAAAEVSAGRAATSRAALESNLLHGPVGRARRQAAPAASPPAKDFALLPETVRSRPAAPFARWTLTSSPAASSGSAFGLPPLGQVQRSLDGGQTWQVVPIAEGVSFRAVLADGDDVWAGGSKGTLYHSSDGGDHWTRIRVGDDAGEVSSDIIAINFTESDHGRVITSDGITWMTADGGRHWQEVR